MFYRSKEHIKAQLEERLRTAFDFATLGAYEPDAPSRPFSPRETPKRVFLFAKVSPPCPHSRAAADTCDAAGAETAEHQPWCRAGRWSGRGGAAAGPVAAVR